MKALQIGMTASTTAGGGLDRYFFSLLGALPVSGVDPTGLVSGDTAGLPRNFHSFAGADASLPARMAGLRRAFGPRAAGSDVIVSHFAPYALPVLDMMSKKPFVVHFHGPWKAESLMEGDSRVKGMAKGLLEKIVYDRASRFIVLSRAFRDVLMSDYGVSDTAIRIVPGGVDIARFENVGSRAHLRTTMGWPLDRPIVFSMRRLVRAKGLENLIEAATLLRDQIPKALFMIAGTGPLEAELRGAIAARNLEENVRLIGFLDEAALPAAYGAADLFVVPTVALEGFGLVVVESLACGTPALVTPIGGLPEVVSELDERLILKSFEPRDLADGIARALSGMTDCQLPSREECRAYARRFDWNIIAARVAEVYREVL